MPRGRLTNNRTDGGWLDDAARYVEPALTFGSGMLAEPVAGLAGIGRLLTGGSLSDAAGLINRTQEALTYAPRTSGGQAGLQAVGGAIEDVIQSGPVQSAIQGYGQYVEEPILQEFPQAGPAILAGLRTLPEALDVSRSGGGRRAAMGMSDAASRAARRRSKYLTPDEQPLAAGKRAEQIDRFLNQPGFNSNDIAALAQKGLAKKGWYRDSARALVDVFGEEDAKRFAYLLAATSPQTSVESNLRNALNTWTNWAAEGRPSDPAAIKRIMENSVERSPNAPVDQSSVLPAWENNSIRALTADLTDRNALEPLLSGPKVESFARNLMGELGEVTNDTWMARALGTEQLAFGGKPGLKTSGTQTADEMGVLGRKSPGYLAANVAQREAADILSKRLGIPVEPAEIQEMVWSYVKPLWETRGGPRELRSMQDIVAAGDFPESRITETPDFATLLAGRNEFGDTLRGAGYDTSRIRPHTAQSAIDVPVPQAPYTRAMDRLETRYRNEQAPLLTRSLAEQAASGGGPYAPTGRASQRYGRLDARGQAYEVPDTLRARMESLGLSAPRLVELSPEEASAAAFRGRLSDAREALGERGLAVDVPGMEELAQRRLFLTPEGGAGFSVDPTTQEIGALFRHPGAKYQGIGTVAPLAGSQFGGEWLNAYDVNLPQMYSRAGFEPTARVAFDPTYGDLPEFYRPFNQGQPDIMFMRRNPEALPMAHYADPLQPYLSASPSRPETWWDYHTMAPAAKKTRASLLQPDFDTATALTRSRLLGR